MKKTTRILSLVLAFVMVLSCIPGITVSAAGGRKWFALTGGANNSGGHNYGNGNSAGPLFYLDGDRIILYIGRDSGIRFALEEAFGAPFAGTDVAASCGTE